MCDDWTSINSDQTARLGRSSSTPEAFYYFQAATFWDLEYAFYCVEAS